jgi:hypothetical protein
MAPYMVFSKPMQIWCKVNHILLQAHVHCGIYKVVYEDPTKSWNSKVKVFILRYSSQTRAQYRCVFASLGIERLVFTSTLEFALLTTVYNI